MANQPTSYTPYNGTNPSYGQQGPSVATLQQNLNQQLQGTPGFTPLAVDSKYGPLTLAAANMVNNLVPRQSPTAAPSNLNPEGQPYNETTPETPASAPTDPYASLIKIATASMDAVQKAHQDSVTNALGDSQGQGEFSQRETNIQQGRDAAAAAADQQVQTATANIANLTAADQTQAQAQLKTLASNNLDWENYKTTNPQNYQNLVTALGGDPNVVDAVFAANIPPANIQSQQIHGNSATTVYVSSSGKIGVVQQTLPVSVPPNWGITNGTDGGYVLQDKNNSSNFVLIGASTKTDPVTGLVTKTLGVTGTGGSGTQLATQSGLGGSSNGSSNSALETSNSATASQTPLASAIAQEESGNDYSAVGTPITKGQNVGHSALGKYQIMPNLWFQTITPSMLQAAGVNQTSLDPNNPADIQTFLGNSSLQDALFGNIVSGLSNQYGGDQAKVAAAYFGGDAGAKAYGTPAGDKLTDGQTSVNQYVKNVLGNIPNTSNTTTGLSQQAQNTLSQIGVSPVTYTAPDGTSVSYITPTDLQGLTAPEKAAVRYTGVKLISAKDGDVLDSITTAQANTQSWELTLQNLLPSNYLQQPEQYADVELNKYLQTDQDLQAFNTWTTSIIQLLPALKGTGSGGGGGAGRLYNTISEDLPKATDTVETATDKITIINQLLADSANSILGLPENAKNPNQNSSQQFSKGQQISDGSLTLTANGDGTFTDQNGIVYTADSSGNLTQQ